MLASNQSATSKPPTTQSTIVRSQQLCSISLPQIPLNYSPFHSITFSIPLIISPIPQSLPIVPCSSTSPPSPQLTTLANSISSSP